MTKDEAIAFDLALNALLWANNEINDWRHDAHGYKPEDQPQIMEAITAIKQARSAPVQEPTCKQSLQVWVISNGKGAGQFSWDPQDERFWTRMEPAAQRQWVGLSQDELDAMFSNTIKGKKLVNWVAKAIEAKLKEKNT